MSRKMYVTDDMGLDDALVAIADADPMLALMWPWFVPLFDDWGRADANARRLKGKGFPNFDGVTVAVVEAAVRAFAEQGLIVLYEVDGVHCMAIEPGKWFTYQSHIHKDKRRNDGSRYPPPSSDNVGEDTPRGTARRVAESRDSTLTTVTVTVTPSPPSVGTPTGGDGEPMSGKRSFVRPTLEEAESYFAERGTGDYPVKQGFRSHADEWWNHHESRGWVLTTGKKMIDWKGAARTWIGNIPRFSSTFGRSTHGNRRPSTNSPGPDRYAHLPPSGGAGAGGAEVDGGG